MFKPEPLPDGLQSRSFTLGEARCRGISTSRTRASDLATPSRTIRVPRRVEQSLLSRLRPYMYLGTTGIASHTTAAFVHKIPLPRSYENEPLIHLTRAADQAMARRHGVVGHRSNVEPAELVMFDDVRVTSPARTWLDLAQILPLEDLVVAGDYLVCEHHRTFGPVKVAIVSLAKLTAYVETKRGIPGLRRAREALKLMRVGADSPPETRLRLLLARQGLPEFIPDCLLKDQDDVPQLWVDLGCRKYKVCGEYEGSHHLTPEKQAADRTRDRLTAELGWRQVKIYARDMALGELWVAQHFIQALEANGWRRG